jgi:hypothetical protein
MFGQDYFFAHATKNIKVEYCTFSWMGGSLLRKKGNRLGGGGGCWHSCENMVIEHCYFTQQFDTASSPQYNDKDEKAAIFKDYKFKSCLIEYTEYAFEFFNTQGNRNDNCFKGLYVGYNFCRLGGLGFGDKTKQSRYLKSWNHDNVFYDSIIEKNIFDRAVSVSVEIVSHAPGHRGDDVSFDYMPKVRENLYIEPRDKDFAQINCVTYKYNQASFITLNKLGIDEDSVFIFAE